jgi:WD40 repeat protein
MLPGRTFLLPSCRSAGVHIWDTGAVKDESQSPSRREPLFSKAPLETGWMRGVCFLPGQETLLLGTDDGKISLWDYPRDNFTLWTQTAEVIRVIAASPDGTQVVIGAEDGGLFIASAPGGQPKSVSQQPSHGWLQTVFGKK